MRVISRRRLADFWQRHPPAAEPLLRWYKVALRADWATIQDVRRTFPHADAVELPNELVVTVFNIGGNKYRLIVRVIYDYRRIYVKLVLTHKEYDREDWKARICRE